MNKTVLSKSMEYLAMGFRSIKSILVFSLKARYFITLETSGLMGQFVTRGCIKKGRLELFNIRFQSLVRKKQ